MKRKSYESKRPLPRKVKKPAAKSAAARLRAVSDELGVTLPKRKTR